MELNDMKDLLEHEVRDILYAERKIVKALPKMANAAHNPKLKKAFEDHLEETRGQIERLEQVCEHLGIGARGEKCEAIEGLLEEGEERINAKGDDAVLDAALISAAQRVEHYEMAAYGSARAFAEALGLTEVVDLLQETLDEEGKADKTLNKIAKDINALAARGTAKA